MFYNENKTKINKNTAEYLIDTRIEDLSNLTIDLDALHTGISNEQSMIDDIISKHIILPTTPGWISPVLKKSVEFCEQVAKKQVADGMSDGIYQTLNFLTIE